MAYRLIWLTVSRRGLGETKSDGQVHVQAIGNRQLGFEPRPAFYEPSGHNARVSKGAVRVGLLAAETDLGPFPPRDPSFSTEMGPQDGHRLRGSIVEGGQRVGSNIAAEQFAGRPFGDPGK